MSVQLPNDLVFTPLDVLTAEELNQLQDNIEYVAGKIPDFPLASANIATGAITSDKLASNAVTAGKISSKSVGATKIDWGNLGFNSQYSPLSGNLSTTSTTVLTLDVSSFPNGARFLVAAQMRATIQSDSLTMFVSDVIYNNETYGVGEASTWGTVNTVLHDFTKASGQNTVSLKAYKDNSNTVVKEWAYLAALRVG